MIYAVKFFLTITYRTDGRGVADSPTASYCWNAS